MALPREYTAESCPIARSLEIVGERWTLPVARDAFNGVPRFSDFRAHLGIPKAVLSERLSLLVDEGVFAKAAGRGGRDEYVLTAKGRGLWPTIWSLVSWGNQNYVDQSHQRSYRHAACGGTIGLDRVCAECGLFPDVADLVVAPATVTALPRRARRRGQHGFASTTPNARADSAGLAGPGRDLSHAIAVGQIVLVSCDPRHLHQ